MLVKLTSGWARTLWMRESEKDERVWRWIRLSLNKTDVDLISHQVIYLDPNPINWTNVSSKMVILYYFFFQTLRPYLSLPLLFHRLYRFPRHHLPHKGETLNDVTLLEKDLKSYTILWHVKVVKINLPIGVTSLMNAPSDHLDEGQCVQDNQFRKLL